MRRIVFVGFMLCLLLGGTLYHKRGSSVVNEANVGMKEEEVQVVIDAGHGGMDPGKVGIGGILEKDINLKIAKQVDELLKEKGICVIMTREEDVSLGDQEGNSKKVTDLRARVDLINEIAPELVVSIHQNSYTSESIKGAQVFYFNGSKRGEEAAVLMQNALKSIDSENDRQPKANQTYYMLSNTEVPTIIVESGFLTNGEEAELLVDESYQLKVAEAIVEGIQNYLEQ